MRPPKCNVSHFYVCIKLGGCAHIPCEYSQVDAIASYFYHIDTQRDWKVYLSASTN